MRVTFIYLYDKVWVGILFMVTVFIFSIELQLADMNQIINHIIINKKS